MSAKQITKVVLLTIITTLLTTFILLTAFIKRPQADNYTITPTEQTVHAIPSVKAVPIPEIVTFANDTLPMDRDYVKESMDRELLVNSYWQSQTLILIKKSKRYFSIIEPILEKYEIPNDFKYLAVAESSLSEVAVSPSGAKGLWQMMGSAAKDYGLTVNSYVDERYHIEKSTIAACKYLKHAHEKFKDWALVAASYNAGRRGVLKQMEIQGATTYFDMLLNPETARYLYRIVAFKIIFENPEQYNFILQESDYYPLYDTYAITVKHSIKNFSTFAKDHGISYKELKYYNPWLRKPYLKNSRQKSYQILLPNKAEDAVNH
ncbi:lytic transglycosylase domain-containing protein [Halosquirtibacter xylanolyticus]|uniref:lytic transglycosylase domain-containing protein n=1 Tax=Halosquirtibacter xylanolyticus TaxID=3374599 RepID=UPI00374A87ED|nr:lytic transglycosylase domain-containing protein [Prolixibacteraceae bacterium]